MPAPDWRGFFSNPMTYQLGQDGFQAAYQNLAADDENMADWKPEDHMTFIKEMQSLDPAAAPKAIVDENADVIAALSGSLGPLVGKTPDEAQMLGGQLVDQTIANQVTPGIAFAQHQLSKMGIAPDTSLPVLGALSAGTLTTVPQTLLGMLPGFTAQLEGISNVLPENSRMWRALNETLDWASTEGVPGFVNVMGQAMEQGALAVAPEAMEQRVAELSDVKSVGDAVNWAAGTAQQAGASSLPTILASLVPVVGPGAAMIISNAMVTGEYQMDRYRETGKADEGMEAVVRSMPAGLLELVGAAGEAAPALRRIGKEGLDYVGNTAVDILKTLGIEAGTEGAQEANKIANLRDKRGESMNPMDFTSEEWRQIINATAAGAVGGAGFGAAGGIVGLAQVPQAKLDNELIEKIRTQLTPEEAALRGKLDLEPRVAIDTGEARFRAAPEFLEVSEREMFIKGEQLDVPAIAQRTGMGEADVIAGIQAAEQAAIDLIEAPRELAQPTQEGEDVATAIGDQIRALADEAEERGDTELAKARRSAANQVQVVEPETTLDRQIMALGQELAGSPTVVLYTQPKGEQVSASGVHVRRGLIGIDVSNQRTAKPLAIVGALAHELTHNTEETNPAAWQAAVDVLKGTELWKAAQAEIERTPSAVLNDSEIMARMSEMPGVAPKILKALADDLIVRKEAEGPSTALGRLGEWLRETLIKFAGKIGFKLQPMKTKREVAQAAIAIHDLLKAGVVPETEAAPVPVEATPVPVEAAGPQKPIPSKAPEKLLAREMKVDEPVEIPYEKGMIEVTKLQDGGYRVRRRTPGGKTTINRTLKTMAEVKKLVAGIGGPKYSMTPEEFRQQVGPLSPLGAHSFATQTSAIREMYRRSLETGLTEAQAKTQAIKEMRKIKILEYKELKPWQKRLSDFMGKLGVTVTYYKGPSWQGGSSFGVGSVFVNVNSSENMAFDDTFFHELMHDLRRRNRPAWEAAVDTVIEQMPEVWEEYQRKLLNHPGYDLKNVDDLKNETFAWLTGDRAAAIWDALYAMSQESTVKGPIKELMEFIGDFARSFSIETIRDFELPPRGIFNELDLSNPDHILGLEVVRLMSGVARDETYQAVDMADLEETRVIYGATEILKDEQRIYDAAHVNDKGSESTVIRNTAKYSLNLLEGEDNAAASTAAGFMERDENIPESVIKKFKSKAAQKLIRQYNKIREIGNWALIPAQSPRDMVVVRVGTLNTPGISGKRLFRVETAVTGFRTGKASVIVDSLDEVGEQIRISLPKQGRGKEPAVFLNLPGHMPELRKERPKGLDYPVVITGNPTINHFFRPHKSWDSVIKVVRVKPVHNGSRLTNKAVAQAMNYANEIGADVLMTYFRAKHLWILSRYVNFLPAEARDPKHPNFSQYWSDRGDYLPLVGAVARTGDYNKYNPKKKVQDLFRANGWDTHEGVYGEGGKQWWPRVHSLDQDVIDQLDSDMLIEHCDLLHKGCTACRNCQKLTYPEAHGAPIVGLTDEPFCEMGCPQCFVLHGQSADKGRKKMEIKQNLKQQGYGMPDLGDQFPLSIEILQRVARDLGNQGEKFERLRRFFVTHDDMISIANILFLDGDISPHEMVQMQNEILAWQEGVDQKERAEFKTAKNFGELSDLSEKRPILRVDDSHDITQSLVAAVASVTGEKAYFPHDVDEAMLKQHFKEVRSTPVGLEASKPRDPKFSLSVNDLHGVPEGAYEVVDDEVAYGTQYSRRSGPGWSLPHLNRWNWFIKKAQDSFIQFKRLEEVFEQAGIFMGTNIDVRLAETLYHGKVQEATRRIQDKHLTPMFKALREMAGGRQETYQQLLKKFDDYLHARHAPERNAHIREAYIDRKIELLQKRKQQLRDKIKVLEQELDEAEGDLHEERIQNAIKFWRDIRLVEIEKKIEAIQKQPELNSGMTDAQAAGVMKLTRQEGLLSEFSRLAKAYVDPMLKARLDAFLKEGLITKKEYDSVNRYKYYVPLKGKAVEGDIDELLNEFHDFGAGNGFDIRGAELPYVTGREEGTEINPILAQAVVDTLAAFDRIERNRVALALLELAERHPNKHLWEVNKRVKKRIYDKKTGTIKDVEDWWARNQANVVAAKRGGETFYIYLYDSAMASAMKGFGVENLWKWVGVVRSMMRLMAQLYTTYSPEFILTNFARDYQQAIVSGTTDMSAEAAVNIAKNASRAVRGILAANFPDTLSAMKNEYTDAYHELKAEGGKVGFFGMRGVEDTHKQILREMRNGAMVSTMRGARRIGEYIASVNEATENGIRLATYVEAIRQGHSKAEAASLAKNVTVNFNRRGDVGGAIGAGWLFFNASVQGVDRFWKSMKTPAGQKLAAAYTAIGFLTAIWSRAVMGDDEDGEDRYDKISQYTQGRHWTLGIPGTDGDFITIPMPYGFGVWGQLGKELEHMIFSGDDRVEAAQASAARMLAGLTTHFSPIGETSFNQGFYAMARPIVPTLFEPFTDVLANETYWGGNIYPAETPWDTRANSWRTYKPNTVTERLLTGAFRKLNELTGGSQYRPGILDFNANSAAYVLESYIGPTGKFLKRPFELLQKDADERTWNDWIILRRFLSETAPQYYVPGEFYDAVDDVRRAADEMGSLKEQKASREDIDRFMDRHGWKLQHEKRVNKLMGSIKKIRDADPDSKETRARVLRMQRDFIIDYLQSEKR